jgi:hypothetical protein
MLDWILEKTEVWKGHWPFNKVDILYRNYEAIGFLSNDVSEIVRKNDDLWVCTSDWNDRWFLLPALASVKTNEGYELREVY